MTFEGKDKFNASVNSTYAQPLSPGYCRAFARLVSPVGGAFANFPLPGGRASANSGAIPELSNTHAVSYQNVAGKKSRLAHLSRTGIN